jgi:hypothetical protein
VRPSTPVAAALTALADVADGEDGGGVVVVEAGIGAGG